MRKIREVLRLKYELGFTHRTIAKALRVAVGTVSEYLAKAKKGGLSWPLPEELSDGELEAGYCQVEAFQGRFDPKMLATPCAQAPSSSGPLRA